MRLRLTNFSAGYGRVPVVRDISLQIGEGRIVGLLGANGAGKWSVHCLLLLFSGDLATGANNKYCGIDGARVFGAAKPVERRRGRGGCAGQRYVAGAIKRVAQLRNPRPSFDRLGYLHRRTGNTALDRP